ncbi:MAG: hypothetical protein GVY14_08915 [Spirochaetes bacterium]|jgi:hypothetical protein|nr:hypothetical protein [Spirochaetota bacterium]
MNSVFSKRARYARTAVRTATTVVAAITVLGLAACHLPVQDPGGALEVSVGSIGTQSLLPDLDMDVDSYVVSGSGPDGASFERTTAGGLIVVEELTTGFWVIDVVGYNLDGVDVASGSGETIISAGETSQLTVAVRPYEGPGTLRVSVTWPDADVTDPSVVASLVASDGTSTSLPFDISGAGQATYESVDTAAGYYTLSVQVLDAGIAVAGAAEATRVAAGATTSGTIAFNTVNPPTGDTDITIDPDLDEPLEVSLSGAVASLAFGDSMSVTGAVSNADGEPVSFTWYLNGAYLAAGDTVTLGQSLVPGTYRLDAIAYTSDGSRSGSASHGFSVVE